MKGRTFYSLTALLVTIVVWFFCTVPTDPALDPGNADARLVVENGGSLHVDQGQSRTIGLYLDYPQHFEKLIIASSCNVLDTVIVFEIGKTYNPTYFSPVFTTSGECVVTATAFFLNKELNVKTTRLEFYVKSGVPTIEFIHVPAPLITHTGNGDTLLFVTRVKGSAVAQAYSVTSQPPIDPSLIRLLPAGSNDTARVVFNPAAADSFTVSVAATAQVPAASPVKATATVGIRVFSDITPSKVDAPQNIIAGTADTLRFAIDNTTRTDKLTIKLVTDKALDPAIFTILPSGGDSVVIAISSTTTAAASSAKIGIATGNGIITDTAWYPVIFIDKESVLWYNTELTLPATEGIPLRYDLKPLFIKPQNGTVTFSASPGTVTPDTFWQYTPAYGSAEAVKAVVTAQKGSASLGLTMVITVTPGDTAAPVVSLADPTLNGKKVSSSQITLNCIAIDKEAGVAAVSYSYAGKTIAATALADNVWSGIIAGLENGKTTEISIIATDKSMKKNNASIKFSLTYDSTTLGAAPVITTQLPATAQIIEGETLTLKIAASGTLAPSYQWFKNNELQAGQTNPEYSKKSVATSDSGSYSVLVSNGVGTGVSSAKTIVTIRQKAQIIQEPVATTVNEGGASSFTIKAIGEAPISYQWYKNGEIIAGATTSPHPISGADTADNGKKFTCIVSNTFSSDTSNAAVLTVSKQPVYVVSFNTDGGGSIDPLKVKEGDKAAEPAKPTKQGYEFDGWFAASGPFDFSKTITSDIALTARWTQLFTLTYDVNGGTGSVPAAQKYRSGSTADIEPFGTISNTGCTCLGWGDGKNTYNAGSKITMTRDTTLWAVWQTTVTFDYRDNDKTELVKVILGNAVGSVPGITVGTPNSSNNATFKGWFTAQTGGQPFTKDSKATKSMIVYAQWETIQYEVKFTDPSGGNSSTAIKVDAGKTIIQMGKTCPTLNNQGDKNFAGWSNSSICTTPITGNITVTAKWDIIDCSIVPARKDWDVINICSGEPNVLNVTHPNCTAVQKSYVWHMGLEGTGSPLTDTYDNGEGGYYYGQGTSSLNVRLGGMWTEFFCVVTFANGQKDSTAYWRVATCP